MYLHSPERPGSVLLRRLAVLIFPLLLATSAFGQGTLTLSSVTVPQGGSASLSLSLTLPSGAGVAALQWKLTYPPADIVSIRATATGSATAAGKSLACGASSGAYSCILAGMNATTIQNGDVAAVSLTLAPSAATTRVAVTAMGSTASGTAVTVSGGAGTVTANVAATPTVARLTCAPTSLGSSGLSSCTVTLKAAAAANTIVTLASSVGTLTVPIWITVMAGSASATFAAMAGTVSSDQTATVTATLNGGSQAATISLVSPATVSLLSCTPGNLGQGRTSSCTITLSKAAGTGGATVIVSSNAAAVWVPSSLAVPAGSSTASFTATAGVVTVDQTATVTASLNGGSRTVSLMVLRALPSLSMLACTPAALATGGTATCTVTLSSAAGTGGASIGLSSNTGALSVPASVTVAAGFTSAIFTAAAGVIASAQTAVITATYSGLSVNTALTLGAAAPASISSLACDVTSLFPSTTTHCTVILTNNTAGSVIQLGSSASDAMVPSSLSVPAQTNSVGFYMTAPNRAGISFQVTASLGSSSRSVTIFVVQNTILSAGCRPDPSRMGILICTGQ